MAKYTTKNLVLGMPEAEAEANDMLTLYHDYMGIEGALARGKFIITGRKGSGKSAYAVWLKAESKNKQDLWCTIIKHNDRILEQIFRMPEENGIDQAVLFEWIIIYNLIVLITDSDEGRYGEFASKLFEFRKDNAKLMNEGIYNLQELIVSGGVNLTSLRVPILKIFGSAEKKLYRADFISTLHYLKAVLQKALMQENLKDIRYFLIFDDLDVKFKLNNYSDKSKLVDLIRTARDYNTSFLSGTSSRILLLLRDDISAKLSAVECDTNKILQSYEHHIEWYNQYNDGNDLRQFINQRIEWALIQNNIKLNVLDHWDWLLGQDIDDKSSFKYVLDNTFYLPRDILTIFQDIYSRNIPIPIPRKELDMLLDEYSKSKIKEIRNELVAMWDEQKIDAVFEMLGELFDSICDSNNITYSTLLGIAEEYDITESDIDTLIEYSLIIPKDISSKKIFIKYREKVPTRNKSRYYYVLHKVLVLYFNAMQ